MNKSEVDDLFKEYTRVTPHEEEEAEIIYDKRKINSERPEGNFDTFYKELYQILEEFGKRQTRDEIHKLRICRLQFLFPSLSQRYLDISQTKTNCRVIMNVPDRCSLD